MKKDISQTHVEEAPKGISLETIIAVGVFVSDVFPEAALPQFVTAPTSREGRPPC